MKFIFLQILFCILYFVNSFGQIDNSIEISSIKIDFIRVSIIKEKASMSIINKEGNYYASKLEPNYYYGTNTDSIWTLKLDSSQIHTIYRFIEKAKELENNKCSIRPSSRNLYKVTINNQTSIIIKGNCEWNGLDYKAIEKKIFKEKFDELDLKRNLLKDSIRNTIEGKWIVSGLKKDPKRHDIVILDKLNDSNKLADKTIWSFKDSIDFKSHTNDIINLKYSMEYWLSVSNGYVSLTIRPGYINNNGKVTQKNKGLHFRIKKRETGKIVLEYWGM